MGSYMSDLLRQLLTEEEGYRNKAYQDVEGIWSIGVGRNLMSKGLSDQEIDLLLTNDMREAQAQAAFLPGYSSLNDVQKAVICSMIFQLGIGGLKAFKALLAALAIGDVALAAREGLDSLWAKQVTARAARQMEMLATGHWVAHT